MKAGKLKESILKRSVLKQLHKKNEPVLARPAVGKDYGAVRADDDAIVVACDPVVITGGIQPGNAIISACNNVVCVGALPVAATVSLLLPTSTNEEELRDIMKDLDKACELCNVEIINGHTEVTRAVNLPIVNVAVIAHAMTEDITKTSKICPGMDIVLTKWVGMEGASYLVSEREEELRTRYAQPFIDKAKIDRQLMSVIPEAAVAKKFGGAAMHDVSEGGVFGALWELAEGAGVGLEIDLKKIPIRQETIEICEFFDHNPYKIVSAGCLLIVTEDGTGLVMELEKEDIPSVVIGKVTDSKDRVLLNEDEKRFLERN